MGLRGVRMQRSEVIEDCGILRGWGWTSGFHTSEKFLYILNNCHVTNEDFMLWKGSGSCMMDMILFIPYSKVPQISYFLCELFDVYKENFSCYWQQNVLVSLCR
jgi:hypothetical protein